MQTKWKFHIRMTWYKNIYCSNVKIFFLIPLGHLQSSKYVKLTVQIWWTKCTQACTHRSKIRRNTCIRVSKYAKKLHRLKKVTKHTHKTDENRLDSHTQAVTHPHKYSKMSKNKIKNKTKQNKDQKTKQIKKKRAKQKPNGIPRDWIALPENRYNMQYLCEG